jgi:hypothetical protein
MATIWDRFHKAALALVGAGTVKQSWRLRTVATHDLRHAAARSAQRFQALTSKLTSARRRRSRRCRGDGAQMSDLSDSCHRGIVEMFYMLESPSQALRPHGLRAVSGQS